jgi:hypothetical protein
MDHLNFSDGIMVMKYTTSARELLSVGLVLVLVLQAGCTDPSVDEEVQEDPTESATLHFDEVATLDGEEWAFGEIVALTRTPDGHLFVADAMAREVIVIDSDGREVRRLGGEGQGPGEFVTLDDLALHPEGVLALDSRRRSVHVLTLDGALVRSGGWEAGERVSALLDGVSGPIGLHLSVPSSPEPGVTHPAGAFVRFDDDLGFLPLPGIPDPIRAPRGVDCATLSGWIHPFSTRLKEWHGRFAELPDGRIATALDGEFAIVFHEPGEGVAVDTLRRAWPRVPIDRDEWESKLNIAEVREGLEPGDDLVMPNDHDASCPPDEMVPDALPMIRSLFSDGTGRLWIEAYHPDGLVLSVYDPEGGWVGYGRIPHRDIRVTPHASGDDLWVVAVDEFGSQSVVQYRVRE